MEEKLIKIATRVFGLTDGEITMTSTPDNTENWDSLRHIRLILEVEECFNFEMDESEITEIIDLRSLAVTIAKYKG
jgi:acyl carrier protein